MTICIQQRCICLHLHMTICHKNNIVAIILLFSLLKLTTNSLKLTYNYECLVSFVLSTSGTG